MQGLTAVSAQWPAPDKVKAVTTTRCGGVSRGAYASLNLADHVGDDPRAVAVNRQRMQVALELPAPPTWLRQVHGNRVVAAETVPTECEADAIVATAPGLVCAVLTADCVPVLLCSRDGSSVAAVHAGWRGLLAGVVENSVDRMGVPPDEVLAWLGPGISQPCFEVGEEVRAAFVGARDTDAEAFLANQAGRWQADLYLLLRRRLERVGVTGVFSNGFCTYADNEEFYSHRRDGACGRMASLIWIAD